MNKTLGKLFRNGVTIPFTPFYRKYRYTGKVSRSSADSRGCVDMELGFFYNRIPKAANSTVVTNLARIKTGEDIPSRTAKQLFRTPSALGKREVDRVSSLFRFTIVRNPYTRVLSAYLDKVERRALRDNRDVSFPDFLQSLQKGKLYSNAHWAPQSELLLLPLECFDFIGKIESLENDLTFIKNAIRNDTPDACHTSILSNATGAGKKIAAYYDKNTTDIVRTLYRDDFELFCYSYDLPDRPGGSPVEGHFRP